MKNYKYNNNNIYNNESKSQQNRKIKRNKLESFTISIPIYNNENNNNGEESDFDNINNSKTDRRNNYKNLKNLKYSELKTNKITPEKEYNNFYLNKSLKNINSTPVKDYSVNWQKGNSTCAKIIKNESDQEKGDYNLNNYTSFTNKGRNNKIKEQNKSKSGFDYISGNKGYYFNNNINKNNDSNRKKLFI